MKKSGYILAVVFLLTMVSFQRIEAQEKSDKGEKEKEQQIQEAIDAQKKAIVEQKKAQESAKKAQEEALKAVEEHKVQIEKAMEEARKSAGNADELGRVYRDMAISRGSRNWFNNGEPFVISPGIEFYGQHMGGDGEKTTWEFSKTVKEATFSREYTIDVESTVSTVVMAVNGDCRSGEIRVRIIMPNGKTYSDIVIDEFGNLNWRKSFTISDEENQDKAGAWKFQINSSKAEGYFKISLQTY